jgi:hypothetical protein
MLQGNRNPKALAQIDALEALVFKTNGITSVLIEDGLIFIETRNGRIDASFNLEEIYEIHRKLIKTFVYAAACNNAGLFRNITTDANKISVVGAIDGADADVIENVASRLPVVRASNPFQDVNRQAVSYRVPLGGSIALLELVKADNKWKIDSDHGIKIDVSIFSAKMPPR